MNQIPAGDSPETAELINRNGFCIEGKPGDVWRYCYCFLGKRNEHLPVNGPGSNHFGRILVWGFGSD